MLSTVSDPSVPLRYVLLPFTMGGAETGNA
jgi:hypothetical protein